MWTARYKTKNSFANRQKFVILKVILRERWQYTRDLTSFLPWDWFYGTSVTRLWVFWKLLGQILLQNSQKCSTTLLRYCENCHFYVELLWILFGHLLEKIGLLFTPTSGRTEDRLITVGTWVNFFPGLVWLPNEAEHGGLAVRHRHRSAWRWLTVAGTDRLEAVGQLVHSRRQDEGD